MTPDAVIMGTDPAEVWTRDEFAELARSYFDSKQVWKFKGKDRHIYFSDDSKTCWFDEVVQFDDGDWRGTGVLTLGPEGWKIRQYIFFIAVPNDLMDSVITMIKVYYSGGE